MNQTDPLPPDRERKIREVVQHSRGWAGVPSTWTRMLHDVLGEVDRLRAVVSPPTSRADLRDRIAQALYPTYGQEDRNRSLAIADAVLAVPGVQADPAAVLRWAADHFARMGRTVLASSQVAAELRRLAGEAHDTGTQQQAEAPTYPHPDGDVTVLGPEVFASNDGNVICWRGENYIRAEQATVLRIVPAEQQPAADSDEETRVVAYRSVGGRIIRCLTHVPPGPHGDFRPVTADDLPDGGICSYPQCGVDVLIPQPRP